MMNMKIYFSRKIKINFGEYVKAKLHDQIKLTVLIDALPVHKKGL